MVSDTLKAVLVIAVSSVALMAIWVCRNRYSVVVAGKSTAYRLNRLTGEVWLLRLRRQHSVLLMKLEKKKRSMSLEDIADEIYMQGEADEKIN